MGDSYLVVILVPVLHLKCDLINRVDSDRDFKIIYSRFERKNIFLKNLKLLFQVPLLTFASTRRVKEKCLRQMLGNPIFYFIIQVDEISNILTLINVDYFRLINVVNVEYVNPTR